MKKILVVVPDVQLGGVTASVINFCNELIEQKNEVHFLNLGREGLTDLKRLNSEICILFLEGTAKYWRLGMNDVKIAKGLKKISMIFGGIVKKLTNHSERWLRIVFSHYRLLDEYDVVVAFKQCAPCYYFALNCVQAKKRIAFVHGDIKFMGDTSSWDYYFQKFDYVACVSNAVRDGFIKRYNSISEKFQTVYNMFDSDFINKQSQVEFKEKFPEDLDCCIVTVARIENATKHIDIIPTICSILKEKTSKKFHWYVVGDGPDYHMNSELAMRLKTTDVLTFCGAMKNPYNIMKKADFTVLTSRTEAYSMVVIESLILGKPIVVTRYPGVEEAVNSGINGLIAEQDVDDITEKILSCIENKAGILTMMQENLKTRNNSNDNAYTQFLDCIR